MRFKCKQFDVIQSEDVFKITTDATLLGALSWNDEQKKTNSYKILEIGSGTGIVSLMLAQRFSLAHITAIDTSFDAFKLTELNFRNSTFSDRLIALQSNLFDHQGTYDRIIMNPPYFQNDTVSISPVQKRSRHLEENITYKDLLNSLIKNFQSETTLEFIHPERYSSEIDHFCKLNNLYVQRRIGIRHHIKMKVRNCISRLGFKEIDTTHMFFELKQSNNQYSQNYVDLLRPFINV